MRHPNARRSSTTLVARLVALATRARSGRALRDGLSVAIAGPPNAGKSSLLNRLAGYDAAIVTEIPGTTRDPLREHLALDGLPVTIVDTAGLRDTNDPVEREGVRRAKLEVARADRLLWVADAREPLEASLAAARAAHIGRRRVDDRREQDRSRRRRAASAKRAGDCDRLRLGVDGRRDRPARRAPQRGGRYRRRKQRARSARGAATSTRSSARAQSSAPRERISTARSSSLPSTCVTRRRR